MIFNRVHFPEGAPEGRKNYAQAPARSPLDEVTVKAGADTKTKYVFILSSDTPDMMGDIINQDGWDFSRIRKSAPALWAHDAGQFPIGSWTEIWREGNKLIGAMVFAPTNRAQQARTLVESGHLKGVSVGFTVGKYTPRTGKSGGLHYQDGHMLLEASLCPIGCQPDALYRGVSKAGDPKAYKQELRATAKAIQAKSREHEAKAAAENAAKRQRAAKFIADLKAGRV
jgi:HK97 family phage prohead protease